MGLRVVHKWYYDRILLESKFTLLTVGTNVLQLNMITIIICLITLLSGINYILIVCVHRICGTESQYFAQPVLCNCWLTILHRKRVRVLTWGCFGTLSLTEDYSVEW